SPTAKPKSCSQDKNEFLCENKKCISANLRCNFFDDCGDGSDEESCSHDHKSYDCMTNTTMCGDEAQCIQSQSTTYCTCRRGFQKLPDKNSCQDINECLRFGTCSQLCNNTKGSHVCSCAKNFMKTDNMCKAEGSEHQILYIADDNKIRSMYPFNPNSAYEPAFQGDENVRIDAMDIYVKGNKIYWTNWHTGRISYRELPASSSASPPRAPPRPQPHPPPDRRRCHPPEHLGAEDATGHRHRLGRREHLLDGLGAGCH
ncbi:PREDICTED: low-density lipoprotein receptor-related protein 1-like, partial [Merops nubicus]|uniref:low-density lipoprotein receptor-related protein 1-like n=1 Tax=Merops nubicus TaxID=57421 RepID=UPI0004F04DFF